MAVRKTSNTADDRETIIRAREPKRTQRTENSPHNNVMNLEVVAKNGHNC